MGTLNRAQAILMTSVSPLVIYLTLALILFAWIVQANVSSLASAVLHQVDLDRVLTGGDVFAFWKAEP